MEEFDFTRINKSPAVFDMTKLAWMNGEYLHAMDGEEFYKIAEPHLRESLGEGFDLRKIAQMVQSRIQLPSEIEDQVSFLRELPEYSTDMYVHKKSKSTKETSLMILSDVLPLLTEAGSFDNDGLFDLLSGYASSKELKINTVMWPIRTALSGKQATPAGATGILELLGKEESVNRIKKAIDKLSEDEG